MATDSSIDQVWQRLLRHAGKTRTPHFRMDATTLAPLRRTLRGLGEPQKALRIVHIAGSKGKGSTAFYLERLLLAHGQQVATFTSPHLQHWRERFRIGGVPAADQPLLQAAQRLQEALATQPDARELRFFDLLTAIAMTLFARTPLDWVLLETGVGGRFDATNVVQPALCILTRLELEHC
ncbi:MAG: hypothetical protein OEN20_07370, partial [Gammaproteobacteria bacterium]|nr:hypothetical protein [Gammaproteobacteria bacterium]